MVEIRLTQIAGYGLTPAEHDLYRHASETTLFAFAPSAEHQAARAAVAGRPSPP